MLTPREEAAVDAATVAARAVARSEGGYGGRPPVEVLERRLGPLDWSSFNSRGYELVHEVSNRIHGRHRRVKEDGEAHPASSGARYEESVSAARERLSRASA